MDNDHDARAEALTRLEAAELELAALLEGAVRLASDLAGVREALTVPVLAVPVADPVRAQPLPTEPAAPPEPGVAPNPAPDEDQIAGARLSRRPPWRA